VVVVVVDFVVVVLVAFVVVVDEVVVGVVVVVTAVHPVRLIHPPTEPSPPWLAAIPAKAPIDATTAHGTILPPGTAIASFVPAGVPLESAPSVSAAVAETVDNSKPAASATRLILLIITSPLRPITDPIVLKILTFVYHQ